MTNQDQARARERHEDSPKLPRAGCVDCPAVRAECFVSELGHGAFACRFTKGSIAARAPLPAEWADRYAFALVRRGVVIRTRADEDGPSIAIDCAGAGTLLPIAEGAEELGYAATEAMVCLYSREVFDEVLAREPAFGREVYEGFRSALERVERLAQARGQSKADDRVARVLSVVAATHSPAVRRGSVPAGLQQRDLARLAGVRHESFCRTLAKLERAGAVRRDDEGLFIERPELLATT